MSEYYSQAENWNKLVQLYERDLGPAGHTRADRLGDMLQIAMLHYRKRDALSDAAPWFQRIREIEPANGAMLTFYRDFARETGDEALLLTVLQAAQKVLPEARPGARSPDAGAGEPATARRRGGTRLTWAHWSHRYRRDDSYGRLPYRYERRQHTGRDPGPRRGLRHRRRR